MIKIFNYADRKPEQSTACYHTDLIRVYLVSGEGIPRRNWQSDVGCVCETCGGF